jgi:hypothetical protein
MNRSHKLIIVLCIVSTTLFSCQCRKTKKVSTRRYPVPELTVETFKTSNGWGYEIKIEGKTRIRQSVIPAVQGNLPFGSETEALRVGELVVQKMKRNEQLPTVSIKELDSLQITY